MDYSRIFTLLLSWKREKNGRQGISTVKSWLECFAKALQIALEGSSISEEACSEMCVLKPKRTLHLLWKETGSYLTPVPREAQHPGQCHLSYPAASGDADRLPKLRWVRCHLHLSPMTVTITTTNTGFLGEGIMRRDQFMCVPKRAGPAVPLCA